MTFDFFNVPRIVFGRGVIARLGEFVPKASRIMLVYNGRKPALESHCRRSHQRGEADCCGHRSRLTDRPRREVDFVLGVGGGSAIDAAQGSRRLLANGGVASDYMEVVGKGRRSPSRRRRGSRFRPPPAPGAEVTRNAVIGWPEKKVKASIRSELLMAKIALIDPTWD
jgi:alcohol dehydrogenase class IV